MTSQSPVLAPAAPRRTLGQALRFFVLGVGLTALDFAIFSVLRALAVPLVPANLCSTSCGMVVSFFANRSFVFSATAGGKRQAVLFVLGTAFSLYVLQSLAILGITHFAEGILDRAVSLAAWAGLRSETSAVLVRSNTAKLVATGVSLTWNFLFYKYAVFPKAKDA